MIIRVERCDDRVRARRRKAVRRRSEGRDRLDWLTMQTTAREGSARTTTLTAPDHLSPVLDATSSATWSHGEGHRLWDADGSELSRLRHGLAVSSLGHAPSGGDGRHPCAGGPAHPHAQRARLRGARSRSWPRRSLVATLPAPLDTVFFLNSGAEAIEGARQAGSPRRPGGRASSRFPGGFHGRTYGATSVDDAQHNYRPRHGPLLPGVHHRRIPRCLSRLRWRRRRGDRRLPGVPASRSRRLGRAATRWRRILIEPVQGEGGYRPAPAAFLQGLRAPGRPARHPAHRGRGPVGLRADRPDVGLRARRHRARRRDPGQGHRQRPAALGRRQPPRAAGALGQERPRHDVRWQPGLVRRRYRGPRDDPDRGARGQRGRSRRAADGRARGAGGHRSRASAMSAARASWSASSSSPIGRPAHRTATAPSASSSAARTSACSSSPVAWTTTRCAGSRRIDVSPAEIDEALGIFAEALATA